MAQATFHHVRISGMTTVVPPREISIYDEAQYYGNDIKKIDRMRKMVGFYKRRVVDAGVTPADLALCAARKLLKGMSVAPETIDALVFVLQSPDHPAPASAFWIHRELGLPQSCLAFDVNLGCPGWVYGLHLAHTMVESGAHRRVLLLVADTPSTKVDIDDRVSAPLFGDAAAATLVEHSERECVSHFELGAEGKGYEAILIPAGGARLPFKFAKDPAADAALLAPIAAKSGHTTDLAHKYMNGLEVFNFTMTVVPGKIKSLMAYAQRTPDDFDALVLHQANKQIVDSVSQLSGFPSEKTSSATFETFGNQTVVSVPSAICHTLKDAVSQGSARLLCAGFGIGLAWGVCALTMDKIYCGGVESLELPGDHPERARLVDYWTQKMKTM